MAKKNTDDARANTNSALSRLIFCDFVQRFKAHEISLLLQIFIFREILHVYYILMEISFLFTITTLFHIYEIIYENS